MRALLATLALFGVVAHSAVAWAQPAGDGSGLDPRLVNLLRSHSCGDSPSHADFAAINGVLSALPPAPVVHPTPFHLADDLTAYDVAADHVSPGELAADDDPSPSPAPTSTPDTSTTPAGSGPEPSSQPAESTSAPSTTPAESTAAPQDVEASAAPATNTPQPSPSPSLIPIPRAPPAGPLELVQPTPAGSPTVTPYPLPTPTSLASAGPVFLVRPSGTPAPLPLQGGPAPSATPSFAPLAEPRPTLGPNDVVSMSDRLIGSSDRTQPADLIGNVHIFYSEGQIVGDRAHYDGMHTLVISGHTYLVNRADDSILYADKIVFDTQTRKATLTNGVGESIEGVAQGKLHFAARSMNTLDNGETHGDHAYFTTCENPHAGYHVEARSVDVLPGDKLIARKATIFFGPTAIFYLPLLIIPLLDVGDQRRQPSFLPLIGYDQAEGYFIKAKIGFGTSNSYYGYYRLEYYTKRGLGLGYSAYIGAKDGRRYTTIDFFTISDRTQNARVTNLNLQDVETFSRTLRGQFAVQYQSDYGPNLTLPATINVTGSLIHQTEKDSQNLTFSRFLQGDLSDNLSLGLLDTITFNQFLQEQLDLDYSKFTTPSLSTSTLHIQSLTHWTTKGADYTLTYDKTNYSSDSFGYNKVPELQILPHWTFGDFKYAPQFQFTFGEYSEPQNDFSTSRFQGQLNENYYAKVFGNSDFSAGYMLTQDYYGTGDEKAQDQQNASLNTPIGTHLINSLSYNEQHPIGPTNVPFQLLDQLSSGSHSAQDTLRLYNGNVYSFSLSGGTDFNRQAQDVNYQFNVQPSPRSYVVLGGYFGPGPGNGFGTTNLQAITPFGKDTSLQFTTNIDWKNHDRLEDKNIFLNRIVDNCYSLQLAYNQDLKSFNFNIVILAFPGQGTGFGIGGGNTSQIVPQGLTF
jgi:hypothetical protein